MWKRHWKLAREPFVDTASPYIPLPAHDEAVARIVQTIESSQRFAMIRAGAGLGKSRVLARALAEVRSPSRRIALARAPIDATLLLSTLAECLGVRVPNGASRTTAWKGLADGLRLCRMQRLQPVLAIDDGQDLLQAVEPFNFEMLGRLDSHPDSRLTVLVVSRGGSSSQAQNLAWSLAIRLVPLTQSEVERYLDGKLSAAGRVEPTFTPRALQRLHMVSEGVPRGVDRLATLALMAGAIKGLEIIPPDLIDGVAMECNTGDDGGECHLPGVVDGQRFMLR